MNTITNDTIIKARQGDMDAFIEQCLTSVRYMAYSFSQSSGIDAEDLLQEVGLKLFRKSDKVLAVRNCSGYVKVLARNTMIDHYRKVARRRRLVRLVELGRV
jgi:RNA polymerase sigma factor (sigma-70 family)